MTVEEELEERRIAQISKLARVHAGHGPHFVESPACRIEGPMWRVIDLQGNFLNYADRRHPVGPGRRLRLPVDIDETLQRVWNCLAQLVFSSLSLLRLGSD